jgi:hypothetical protein
MRQRNSERRIERVVREDADQEAQKGILEIFPRDEDEPLSRDADDDEEAEAPTRRRR